MYNSRPVARTFCTFRSVQVAGTFCTTRLETGRRSARVGLFIPLKFFEEPGQKLGSRAETSGRTILWAQTSSPRRRHSSADAGSVQLASRRRGALYKPLTDGTSPWSPRAVFAWERLLLDVLEPGVRGKGSSDSVAARRLRLDKGRRVLPGGTQKDLASGGRSVLPSSRLVFDCQISSQWRSSTRTRDKSRCSIERVLP